MKKTYMTPVINIENFEMDIDILRGMTQADLDFARIDFEMTFADDIASMTDEQIEAIWTICICQHCQVSMTMYPVACVIIQQVVYHNEKIKRIFMCTYGSCYDIFIRGILWNER